MKKVYPVAAIFCLTATGIVLPLAATPIGQAAVPRVERAVRLLGVRTERAMALFFDRTVQQGPGAAHQLAERLLAAYAAAGHRSVPYAQVLVNYAALAAARFWRTMPPPSPAFKPGSTRIVWKQVGNEWHAVTGPSDLHAVIVKRTDAILRDPSLSDGPIRAAVA